MSSKVEIIEIGEKKLKLAFGMEWTNLKGLKSESEEIRDAAKENKVLRYARSQGSGSDVLIGFPIGAEESRMKGKVYSAAQAFATMSDIAASALFVWEFDDDRTWICQVRNGFPVVGQDIILEKRKAEHAISDLISLSDDSITVYGNSKKYPSKSSLNIDDIAFSCGKDDEISKISGFGLSNNATILLILAIVAAGGGGYYYHEQERIAEAKRKQAEMQKVDPNIQYAQQLATLNPGMSAKNLWPSIKKTIDTIPMSAGGWELAKIECELKTAHLCTATWNRVIGSNNDLISQLDLPADANWTIDSTKVTYSFNMTEQTKDKAIDLNTAPSLKPFLISFVSKLQDASLADLKMSLKSQAPYGLPAGVTINDIKKESLISTGDWDMTGDFWTSEFVSTLPDNFSINMLVLTVEGDAIKFNLKGSYYAKN